MSTDLLFEHFATIATAPDGIARLRELILQLAVQGKLGTQDAGDEPADVLLGRIRKEKDRLVKVVKIPKEKSVEYDNETLDRTFPENWIFVRLGEISDKIHYGYTASADQTNRRIRLLRITDIQNNRVNWDLVPGCEIDDSNFLSYSINVGDLLIARTGGTVGKSFLVRDQPVPAVFASYLIRVVPNKNLNSEYVKLFADSPTYWDQLYRMCMGTGQPNVNGMSLRSLIIPLPPLAEQHRIVAKVNRLMAICDELEARQQYEREGCLKLGTSSLAELQNAESPEKFEQQWAQVYDAFDLILDCPENVAVLRQTILQMAVLGMMNTHDSKDEPVEKLMEKIRKEKVQLVKEGKSKKEKPLEPVRADEVPFVIPGPWMWCRFGDIATIETNIVPPDDFQNLPHVAPDNIEKRTGRLLHYRTVAEDDVQSPNHHFYPDHIVYSKIRPNLSKLTIVDFEGLCSADMYPIYSHIFNKYLKIYMLSLPFYNQAVGDENRLAMPKINQTQLNLIYVAVPPLAEQHRIVAKVDSLMALCDALESRLKERAGVQGRLAGAVVKQVAGG